MVAEHYASIVSGLQATIRAILDHLEHPEHFAKEREKQFDRLEVLIHHSNRYALESIGENEARKLMEEYFLSVEELRRNENIYEFRGSRSERDAALKGYLSWKELEECKLVLARVAQDRFEAPSKELFLLQEVIEVRKQQYQKYADDLLWKLRVLKNTALAVSTLLRGPHVWCFRRGNILADARALVQIRQERCTESALLEGYYKFLEAPKKENVEPVLVICLGIVMYQLLFGAVPIAKHPDEPGQHANLFLIHPGFGLLEDLKRSRVHACLMKLTMKCIQPSNVRAKTVELDVPKLDWVVFMLNYVIETVYGLQESE